MQDFRKLKVWERSCTLVRQIHSITTVFPRDEAWGLTGQVRRAAVSIATNIAEGCGRKGGADFVRFLHIAIGSACEVECCLEISLQLGYLKEGERGIAVAGVTDVRRMLAGLIRTLNTDN
jgi:four helix bundle protein